MLRSYSKITLIFIKYSLPLDLTSLDLTFLDLTSFNLTSLDLASLDLASVDLTSVDLASVDFTGSARWSTTASSEVLAPQISSRTPPQHPLNSRQMIRCRLLTYIAYQSKPTA